MPHLTQISFQVALFFFGGYFAFFLPAAADGFVEVEQVEAGGELVVEQVLAEAVGGKLGLQGGVEGSAAVAEELAVVAHLLLRGAFGLL